jgi:TetR/AcrR family transcriptional regulator
MGDSPARGGIGTRDPEARRAALLDAALVEFARHGLAGARTSAIAARAGVNKQLISHHFGGKEGLYRALIDRWLEAESSYGGDGAPLADLVTAYARSAAEDADLHRLVVRASIDGEATGAGLTDADVDAMRRRQEAGEVGRDLDPGFILLALQAVVAAGIVFPDDARRVSSLEPDSPEFAAWHADQLRRLIERLA